MQTKENYHHYLFVCISFCTYVPPRVITLKHNNEELRNTNGCHLVTQFSSNPTNRFIISELSFLAKVTIKFAISPLYVRNLEHWREATYATNLRCLNRKALSCYGRGGINSVYCGIVVRKCHGDVALAIL